MKAPLPRAVKITIAVVLMLVAIMSVIYLRWTACFSVSSFNRASSLDIPLCASADTLDSLVYEEYNDGFFGFSMYRREDFAAEVRVESFPDAVIGSPKITGIYLKENNTDSDILGIKIGDDDNVAYKQLETHGFKSINASNDRITAEKSKLNILIILDDRYKVAEISVTVENTNIFKVQY